MRKLLIFVFVCLMLAGIFLAYQDYQAYLNPTPNEPDLIPARMMLGNAPLDPDIKTRMDEVFEKTESTIAAANGSGKRMASFAYSLGWTGSICSWLILGITMLIKHKEPDSSVGGAIKVTNSKMPRKMMATGILAVAAAVCPLAISKCDLDSTAKYEKANLLRDEKSKVRADVMSGGLAKEKSLELLDKLMDKAGR